ncbi:MAG: glycosyltransferase family 39 protein [Nanoarchaeota archaeon]|nr:glycosyltransferase family 39 protein [Nanoarchaeota archaeon]
MNKKYNLLWIVIGISLLIRIKSLITPHDLWWDSSVYIEMGKYIWSFGKVGLWEPNRPLVWPLILGFFWRIGLDSILVGKILITLFSLGIISLTYLISAKIFNKEVAFLSSLFISVFSTFLRFNNILFSEIPSTFFLMLGIYHFFNKKHLLSGLFLSIAFMTRFFQLFCIIPIFLVYAYYLVKKKASFKDTLILSSSFGLPVLIFLIINYILYKNPFEPFLIQAYMTRNTGWIFHQPFNFYFVNLMKQNYFTVFAIIGLLFISIKKKFNHIIISVLFLFPFILYLTEKHKEMRLLIAVLPFMFMLTADGITNFANLFKRAKFAVLSVILIVFVIQSASTIMYDQYDDNLDSFYDYMGKTEITEGIWISNPSFIVYSEKKAQELIYYPLYYSGKIEQLQGKVDEANAVLINTCDIMPCPESDTGCILKTGQLISSLNTTLTLIYHQEQGSCRHYIFER